MTCASTLGRADPWPELRRIASASRQQLGSAGERIGHFVASLQDPGGGFPDRGGQPDLYYTCFAIETLRALHAPFQEASCANWLAQAHPLQLDLVHCASWAVACRDLGLDGLALAGPGLTAHLGRFRSRCGGFAQEAGAELGNPQAAFLAASAYGACGLPLPDAQALCTSLKRYLNGSDTAPTGQLAACVVLLHLLGERIPGSVPREIGRRYRDGGFLALPQAPFPDLLATATALQALAVMGTHHGACSSRSHTAMLDFIDGLWNPCGAFHAHWAEDVVDVEYTFYGLLALGTLACA